MRSKSSIIYFILSSCLVCGPTAATETEYTQYSESKKYSFIKANLDAFKVFASSLEERESEEAKHRDEEGNFLIDYSDMRVCDVQASTASHYSQVFEEIRPLFTMVTPSQPIVMNFAGNFLQDEGIGAFVDFVIENPLLKNRLKKLDLSNNRFRSGCLLKLKDLVEQCPNLERLNIAINYVSADEVNQAFQALSGDKKRVIHFAVY